MPSKSRTAIFIRAIAISVLISGCTQTPKEHIDITTTISDSFSISGNAQTDTFWWTDFNDPQLTQLVNTALVSNFSLKSSVARVQRAAAIADVRDASRYPDVRGTIESDFRRGRNNLGGDITQNDTQSIKLNASWEVDLWGKNHANATAAYFNYLANAEQLQTAAQSLAGDIARRWYQLTEQHQSLTILNHQISNTKVIAEITGHRYRTGQGSISALWRQEQLLESLQAQEKQAQKRLLILEKQMNVLLGRSPTAAIDWQYTAFPDFPALPNSGIPTVLLERRPDVRGLWYQYEASQQDVSAAAAARLPNFSINTGVSSDDWSNAFELWRLDLGAQLNIPLFNAGKLASEQEAAEASAEIAFYNYTQGVLTALEEVDTNLLEELSQQEQLDSLERQTKQAESILEVESIRYSRGMQGYLDVLNAQEKLFTLQQRTLSAQRQLFLRRIATYQSLGGHLVSHSEDGTIELQHRTES
ncbi:efflux transporter outer membrane subunit [Photobacterium minamisatsumaniensis]|uniref:efflux transporter outer membrane subunit n=1 Tax=Photobacterium minamisatsumaniensis TaxID=2910233 RepID=UPI003D0FD3F6